jgi:hypothetical protein
VVIAIDAASYPMDTAYELAEANASATAPITIRNLGTQTTQLTIGSDNNSFSLLGANTITLGPGAEVITALEYSPVAIASVTEQLSFSYTGVSCGDAPSASASGEARLTKPGQGGAIEALPRQRFDPPARPDHHVRAHAEWPRRVHRLADRRHARHVVVPGLVLRQPGLDRGRPARRSRRSRRRS